MSGVEHPLVAWVIGAAAVLTALGVIWRHVGRPTLVLARRVSEFLDDWNGQPARPGRVAIKPMPARIATLESQQAALGDDLAELRAELRDFQTESTSDRTDLRARLAEVVRGPDPNP